MLKAIKEQYESFKDAFQANRELKDRFFVVVQQFEYKGAMVQVDDLLLRAMGNPKHLPNAVAFRHPENDEMIVVNDAFMELPEYVQHGLLDHEIAHHELGHAPNGFSVKIMAMNVLRSFGYIPKMEYEADTAAQAENPEYINALKYFSEVRKDCKELKIRLKRLKEVV